MNVEQPTIIRICIWHIEASKQFIVCYYFIIHTESIKALFGPPHRYALKNNNNKIYKYFVVAVAEFRTIHGQAVRYQAANHIYQTNISHLNAFISWLFQLFIFLILLLFFFFVCYIHTLFNLKMNMWLPVFFCLPAQFYVTISYCGDLLFSLPADAGCFLFCSLFYLCFCHQTLDLYKFWVIQRWYTIGLSSIN